MIPENRSVDIAIMFIPFTHFHPPLPHLCIQQLTLCFLSDFLKQGKFERLNGWHQAIRELLQVSVHAAYVENDLLNFFFFLCPQCRHHALFLIEVFCMDENIP
jgi:hypothetical protein